ncbi:hypothetical protein TRICI_006602 [Trichomonascus ciferrii]|uniref:Xylanolytic transcriptional activator regulatory domain-containing protein n=1 Tax=Trichomonascus ciferrii TaxID=44093 RepID=A0A642UG34_9ASCO|nr:hypothetical protein TRICI_006602 [Trichomonascus ciferrii]
MANPQFIHEMGNGETQGVKKITACERCYRQKLKKTKQEGGRRGKRKGLAKKDEARKVSKASEQNDNTATPILTESTGENEEQQKGPNHSGVFDTYNSQTVLSLVQNFNSPLSDKPTGDTPSMSGDSKLQAWGHGRPTINEILIHLPPVPVAEYSLTVYFNMVHWFMTVVHEGNVMSKFREIKVALENGNLESLDTDENFNEILLLMIMISLGVKYSYMHPARRRKLLKLYQDSMCLHESNLEEDVKPKVDNLMNNILLVIRANLFSSLSICTLATVQTSILVSSFYLYHGDPNLAWAVLGCGHKAAHMLRLNKEWKRDRLSPSPSPADDEIIQLRRRVFWALYIADRFSAMSYGLPIGIPDTGCDIKLPDNRKAFPNPNRSSYLLMEKDEETNLLTYQTYKVTFYIILGEILAKLYHPREKSCLDQVKQYSPPGPSDEDNSTQQLLKTVKYLDKKLRNWFDSLPELLRLEYHEKRDSKDYLDRDSDEDLIVPEADDQSSSPQEVKARRGRIKQRILGVEALLLQLGYDNAMIILHRPLLRYRSESVNALDYSARSCWEAALRTSKIIHSGVFAACQRTHAGSFAGLHIFNAGVVLYYFGCREIFGTQSMECKRGLKCIIQTQRTLGDKLPVAKPSVQILERLIKLMLQKEMDNILSTANTPHEGEESRDKDVALVLSSLKDENGEHGGVHPSSNPNNNPSSVESSHIMENEMLSEILSEFDQVLAETINQSTFRSSNSTGVQSIINEPEQAWMWAMDDF